jgi:hypothetical protein
MNEKAWQEHSEAHEFIRVTMIWGAPILEKHAQRTNLKDLSLQSTANDCK